MRGHQHCQAPITSQQNSWVGRVWCNTQTRRAFRKSHINICFKSASAEVPRVGQQPWSWWRASVNSEAMDQHCATVVDNIIQQQGPTAIARCDLNLEEGALWSDDLQFICGWNGREESVESLCISLLIMPTALHALRTDTMLDTAWANSWRASTAFWTCWTLQLM